MLSLVTLPTLSLREQSREVTKKELLAPDLQQFCRDMIPAMYHYQGIGLAAPQVDKNVRVCVIGKDADPALKEDLLLVNPEIEILSKKKTTDSEGCLSVPNTYGDVRRSVHLRVKARSIKGESLLFEAKNFFARVIQHEVDHLNGILFIDRAKNAYEISPEEKAARVKKMRAERKKRYTGND